MLTDSYSMFDKIYLDELSSHDCFSSSLSSSLYNSLFELSSDVDCPLSFKNTSPYDTFPIIITSNKIQSQSFHHIKGQGFSGSNFIFLSNPLRYISSKYQEKLGASLVANGNNFHSGHKRSIKSSLLAHIEKSSSGSYR